MKSSVSNSQLKIKKRLSTHRNKYLTFFQHLLDLKKNQMCICQTYNRNTNAFNSDAESQPQLYPHMRKVYNDDTDLLEYVHIIMSTIKPECSMSEEETIAERRRRPTRVSKQRAKVLITEYCTRKIADNIKISSNKRNYSSLCFSSFQ